MEIPEGSNADNRGGPIDIHGCARIGRESAPASGVPASSLRASLIAPSESSSSSVSKREVKRGVGGGNLGALSAATSFPTPTRSPSACTGLLLRQSVEDGHGGGGNRESGRWSSCCCIDNAFNDDGRGGGGRGGGRGEGGEAEKVSAYGWATGGGGGNGGAAAMLPLPPPSLWLFRTAAGGGMNGTWPWMCSAPCPWSIPTFSNIPRPSLPLPPPPRIPRRIWRRLLPSFVQVYGESRGTTVVGGSFLLPRFSPLAPVPPFFDRVSPPPLSLRSSVGRGFASPSLLLGGVVDTTRPLTGRSSARLGDRGLSPVMPGRDTVLTVRG